MVFLPGKPPNLCRRRGRLRTVVDGILGIGTVDLGQGLVMEAVHLGWVSIIQAVWKIEAIDMGPFWLIEAVDLRWSWMIEAVDLRRVLMIGIHHLSSVLGLEAVEQGGDWRVDALDLG